MSPPPMQNEFVATTEDSVALVTLEFVGIL